MQSITDQIMASYSSIVHHLSPCSSVLVLETLCVEHHSMMSMMAADRLEH
jgi:hypothetical protein